MSSPRSKLSELNNAVRMGDTRLVEKLLEEGVDPNQNDYYNNTSLLIACLNGHLNLVKLLLKRLKDAPEERQKEIYHCTLRRVVSSEDLEHETIMQVTKVLLSLLESQTAKGHLDFNERYHSLEHDLASSSTMEIACKRGNAELVKLLLPYGQWNNRSYAQKMLMKSVTCGHTELVKQLLNIQTINVDVAVIADLLKNACQLKGENIEMVKLLLKKDPKSVNFSFPGSWTPLLSACSVGHNKVIEELLDKGADIDFQAEDLQSTALMVAVNWNHLETVKLLCQRGAAINLSTKGGETVLLMITAKITKSAMIDMFDKSTQKLQFKILQELLENGAGVNLQDKRGTTALINAIRNKSVEAVKLLLKFKAKIDIGHSNGQPPLHFAISETYFPHDNEIAKLLLESDDSAVKQKNSWGLTPLMVACMKGNLEMCKKLLEKKSAVDQLDKSGKYALLYSVELAEGHLRQQPQPAQDDNIKIIEKLLERGAKADIYATNSSAQSILRKIARSLIVRISESKFPNLWALLQPMAGGTGPQAPKRSADEASSEQPLKKRRVSELSQSLAPGHTSEHSPPNPDTGLNTQNQQESEDQPAAISNTTPTPEFSASQRRLNLFLYGVEESHPGTPRHKRVENDHKFALSILSEILKTLSYDSFHDCLRIGKYQPNKTRPLLVKMLRARDVSLIFANLAKGSGANLPQKVSVKRHLSHAEKKTETILLKKRSVLTTQNKIDKKTLKIKGNKLFHNSSPVGEVVNGVYKWTESDSIFQ